MSTSRQPPWYPHRSSRRRIVAAAVAVVMAVALTPGTPLASTHLGGWSYPVGHHDGPADVVRGFDPPDEPWLGGHRGVDLHAAPGSTVRAAAAGHVTHAGLVAGRGVVVVRHGTLRTTYEPVDAIVDAGTDVAAGAPIGTLSTIGSHCPPAACLHWGAIDGERYVDPLRLVRSPAVRLLPLGERTLTERPPPPPRRPEPTGLRWPVRNPYVTSPYGMRTHPITGVRKLHDGTDLRAPCGTPILAAAAGEVVSVGSRGAYGLQVGIHHGTFGSTTLATSYSHLSRFAVERGQPVDVGEVIGWAGTTGLSTGCHLHFMVYADGRLTNPTDWLPADEAAARSPAGPNP
ncbi:M23 family metallopeptidase [Phytoactinopolyspora limicola]|uniref:M23 family metallopeptidase n=1 Tax=Phytoactinopolyspora limicola TaxID=2715536 RepID=UPI00140D66C8|nr:peptidoglycan DD-metalloendopeptidase family protein [Phytoactinopolyspora limicola]